MAYIKEKPSPSIRELIKSIFYTLIPPGSKLSVASQRLIFYFRRHFKRLNRDYRKWIKTNDLGKITEVDKESGLNSQPSSSVKFSIIMPVYNPGSDLFKEAIQSVRDQTYFNWELCIADDASSLPDVKEIIDKFQEEDQRIRVVFREENGNISAASNSALNLADGDYVVLFDHDDLLHPVALEYAAKVISTHPNAEIIYSDRDKITERGDRFDPYFKPDFDYELLLGQNYISHLDIYKRETVVKVGGFRVGFEGAQDYDLLLRILEIIDQDDIHHIPQVLYHWRASVRSVAFNLHNKQFAIDSGRKAITEHLQREGITGKVSFNNLNTAYEIDNDQQKDLPPVEIIVLSDSKNTRMAFIENLNRNLGTFPLKITVGIRAEVSEWESDAPKTYPSLNFVNLKSDLTPAENLNQLVLNSEAEIICVMSERIRRFSIGWLKKLTEQCLREAVGAVGPKLLGPNGKVYSDGMILNSEKIAAPLFSSKNKNYGGYYNWGLIQKSYSTISNCCVLFKKEGFLRAGGLNENLYDENSAWIDLFLKMKALGLRNIVVPSVILQLVELPENDLTINDHEFFSTNWGDWIRNDPAFNPNLILKNNEIRINVSKISTNSLE